MGREVKDGIAVLVETSTTRGRDLVRGVAAFARDHGTWSLFVEPRGRGERLTLPSAWSGAGVIADIDRSELAEQLASAALPTVCVSWFIQRASNVARVTIDEGATARLASEHLLDRGLRHLAVLPARDYAGFIDNLTPAFTRLAREADATCNVFDRASNGLGGLAREQRLATLGAWLASLPKPVGVIASSDVEAAWLTDACDSAGLRVPIDVAVLGCEQDELSRLSSNPPLSSVHHDFESLGYAAAGALHAMMNGAATPTDSVQLAPAAVVSRESTDTLAVGDEQLQRVCAYIREHADHPIGVEDLLDQVRMSRRGLERRFMKVLGRTPAATIRRIRVERAMRMIVDSDDSLRSIASACGFGNTGGLTRAFIAELNVKPAAMRKRGAAQTGDDDDDQTETDQSESTADVGFNA